MNPDYELLTKEEVIKLLNDEQWLRCRETARYNILKESVEENVNKDIFSDIQDDECYKYNKWLELHTRKEVV